MKKDTFKKVWVIILIVVNVVGLGFAGIMFLGQYNLTKSMNESRDEEQKKSETIEQMKDLGTYDCYDEFTRVCESMYQEDVDRILEEHSFENETEYYLVEYGDSCAIVDMRDVQYTCDIRGGDTYLLVEKEPEFIDEQSELPILKCVAYADGFLGHPSPFEAIFGIAGIFIFAGVIVLDVIWCMVFMIVGIVRKIKSGANNVK